MGRGPDEWWIRPGLDPGVDIDWDGDFTIKPRLNIRGGRGNNFGFEVYWKDCIEAQGGLSGNDWGYDTGGGEIGFQIRWRFR